MAAGTWVFTNQALEDLWNGVYDYEAATSFKCALFLSTSNISQTSTTYAGLTNEHANANGYTTGGDTVDMVIGGTTTKNIDVTGGDPTWTASGGSIVARFAVVYKTGGNVLCYCLLDSAPDNVTATDTQTFTVAIHASGVASLTSA